MQPYEGDASILTGPTDRTHAVRQQASAPFPEERREGVLDFDVLKRATMPNGGLRRVEHGLCRTPRAGA